MILEKVTGCTCDSLTVDGVQEIDFDDDSRKIVLKRIANHISKLPLDEFKSLIEQELQMYSCEEDLQYMDEFYEMITENGTIKPLLQLGTLLPLDEKYLLIELRIALAYYIENVPPQDLNWILQQVIEALGESEYLFHCEQCFDIVYKYTLEI